MHKASPSDRSTSLNTDPFGWRWIYKALTLHRFAFSSIMLMTGAIYAAGLAVPICIQRAVDLIASGKDFSRLAVLFAVAVGAVAVEGWLSFSRQERVIRLGSDLERRTSRRMHLHLMRLRLDGARPGVGDILNRFQQITKLREFCLYRLPQNVFDLGAAIISIGAIFYYDAPIGVLACVLTAITSAVLHSPIKRLRKHNAEFVKATGERQNVLSESVYGLDTVKALAIEESRIRNWVGATNRMMKALAGLLRLNRGILTSTQLASRTISLFVLVIGCWHISTGHLTVGQLVALELLVARATGPLLTGGGDFFRALQEANVAIDQVRDFLRHAVEPVTTVSAKHIKSGAFSISLQNVSCVYEGRERFALDRVSIELPARGVVALIGRNGSGKSTLIKILSGMHRAYTGDVLVDGQNLRDFHPRWLRKRIGVVLQDTVLFSDTVRNNLSLDRTVDERTLREALEFAGASTFVDALPLGLDTHLDSGGRNLSGGQRQRLSIARAVIRQPQVVIFDEPTAFLDSAAAIELEERLTRWGKDRLLILVTHHLAAARNADHIVMLDAGKVVGQGNHETMLPTVPEYASLWSQYARSLKSDSLLTA